MKNIFISGASGLLGSNLKKNLKNNHIYLGFNKKKKLLKNEVICNPKGINKLFKFLKIKKINIFIHCAGLTNVEFCEKNKLKTYNINVNFTKKIAIFCKMNNIKIIFISSDHLYDGKKSYRKEFCKTSPLNEYAKSKIRAENFIIRNLKKNYLIIRSNFFGITSKNNKKNFAQNVISKLQNSKKIYLFHDVNYTPISIKKLAMYIMKLISIKASGVYNIVTDKKITKYDFGIKLARKFKLNNKFIIKSFIKNRFSKDLVVRPLDMSLSNYKLKKKLKINKICINKCIDIFHKEFVINNKIKKNKV